MKLRRSTRDTEILQGSFRKSSEGDVRSVSWVVVGGRLLCLCVLAVLAVAYAEPHSKELKKSDTEDVTCRPIEGAASGGKAVALTEQWAKQLKSFQASFSQESYSPSLGASEQSGGSVLFENPGKMRWRYQWPERQDFVITGSEMRLYQPSLNQLLIDSAELMLSSQLPVAFLSGVATVSENFSLVQACKDIGAQVRLELTPKQPGTLRGLALIINGMSGQVVGASVTDESENVTSFSFSKIVEDAPVTQEQFTISVPSGTDIQDNRGSSAKVEPQKAES